MNLDGIRKRVRLLVPEATTGVLDNQNLELLINDGALDVVAKTDCLQNYADQDVTAAVQEYSIPTDAIKVLAVYYGGTGSWEKLPLVTMDHLANEIAPDWFARTGTIYAYYKRRDYVGLYQTPTSAEAGTSYLRIYYSEQPATLSSDSDVPFEGIVQLYPYHELIVMYAMYHVKQILGKWEQAKIIEQDYVAKAAAMKVEVRNLDDFQQVIRPYYKGGSGASMKQDPLDQL